jgi:hydroxyacylglutathione hydrolase
LQREQRVTISTISPRAFISDPTGTNVRHAIAVGFLVLAHSAWPQPVPGAMDVRWIEGAQDCAGDTRPSLQVHRYESQTYILRQSPCADFEAPFLYLLIGSEKALLIDTGAVESPTQMPLAEVVLDLLSRQGDTPPPLTIVHTHAHRDHRAGDAQFASAADVEVVSAELDAVRTFFGFDRWPEGVASVDLGERTIAVLPAPGHEPAHVVFYDDRTHLVFSGDFLLPGRLLVDDAQAYGDSARRVAEFLRDRPVSHVLGAHIELDADGELYPSSAQHHPNERRLELTKDDLLALPAAFDAFNGFYAAHPNYVLTNPKRNALVLLAGAVALLAALVWGVRILIRRRRLKAR